MDSGASGSVQDLFDELTGGLRTGDNVVLQTGDEADADLVLADALLPTPQRAPLVYISFRLPPAEVHRRFASGWDPGRFMLVDCYPAGEDDEPLDADVRVQRLPDATPQAVRAVVQAVTQDLGAGTTYVFDGLTGMQQRWSPEEALSLFLYACPKLYEERTIAYWTLQRSAHTPAFLSKIAQVTQVVIDLGRDRDRRWMELCKAHGRADERVGARIEYVVNDAGVHLLARTAASRQGVGHLIKQQRVAAGLSQAELARRVRITPSALSQTERGHHGVSGDVLVRVWKALGLPYGSPDARRATYTVFPRTGRQTEELQPGVTVETITDTPELGMHLVSCAANAAGGRPLFATKRTEVVLVIEGVLHLSIGRADEILQQGDAIRLNEPVRAWRNPADVPARALWTLLPHLA